LTNVRLVAAAVSDREHELKIFASSYNVGLTTTVARRGLREQGQVRAAPLGSLVTQEELTTARLIKIDVEGAEDRVFAGMLASVDSLAAETELVVELSPTWWSDPHLRPIDVLGPFLQRGFHVYLLPNDYMAWRYLWPRDVVAPPRRRDLSSWSGACRGPTSYCHAVTPICCELVRGTSKRADDAPNTPSQATLHSAVNAQTGVCPVTGSANFALPDPTSIMFPR
jgi:hypothetical protein